MCLAVPGRLESIREEEGSRMGIVAFGSRRREVNLACVPEVCVGDYVVVHSGLALQRVSEQAAREALALLGSLEET